MASAPPVSAAAVTATLLGTVAAAPGRAADRLLAATGRRPLPAGFTVL